MAKPQVLLTNSFNEWRVATNTLSDGIGDYTLLSPDETLKVSTFTGRIDNGTLGMSGNVLTVTAVGSGKILVGQLISGNNVANNTYITGFLSGTNGGVGTYSVNNTQSILLISLAGTMNAQVALNDLYSKKANRSGDMFTGAIQINSTLGATGITSLTNATTSSATTNGALVVTGGVGIGGTANIGGIVSLSSGTASTTTTNGALVVTGGVGISGAINAGGIVSLSSGTASTTTTNGSLVVTGGVGISGAINAGGIVSVSSVTASTTTATGALVVTGGVGIGGAANIGGITKLSSGTAATSFTTGALVVTGGVGISGATYLNSTTNIAGLLTASGFINIPNTTQTASTPFITATQTWNNAGVAFSGLQLNITNTASATTSKIIDITSGANIFAINGQGAIVQVLGAPNMVRDLRASVDTKHVREYQDLNDANIQGLPVGEVLEWGWTYNAAWNSTTNTYVRDNSLAGEHATMQRLSTHYSQEWWFADGTTANTPILWSRKVDFDFAGGLYAFSGALSATGNLTIGTNAFTVASATGNAATLGTITATTAAKGFIGNLQGNADTVTNGVVTTGAYTDPTWLTITKAKVGLSLVENTALSTWAGTANITTLGTIATGTWNATTIATNKGGTGLAAIGGASTILGVNTAGTGLEYKSITNTDGALRVTAAAGQLSIDLATTQLPIAKGGTNLTTAGAGNSVLGVVNAGGSLEYKSFTSSDGTVLFTHTAGVIDVKTTGIFPTAATIRGDFSVQAAGAPASVFSVVALTGNTAIAGTLNVAGTVGLGATTATSLQTSGTATLTTIDNGQEVSWTATITTTATTANQILISLPATLYRSACFEIQAVDAVGAKYQRVGINAIHNGTAADSIEFGNTAVGSTLGNISCGTFLTSIVAGNMVLQVTPSSANSTVFKVKVSAMKI